MSLALAIKKNVPKASTNETYQKNVITVNNLMVSISASQLPVLNTPPSNWDEFVTLTLQLKQMH